VDIIPRAMNTALFIVFSYLFYKFVQINTAQPVRLFSLLN
jgi:hypothetical protein